MVQNQNTNKAQNVWKTAARLAKRLHGQRIRLTVVAVSIVIYVGLSIWNPLYSARVIDLLWTNIQSAWKNGTPFVITWNHMGRELAQLTIQYFFTWIFYYLQSYLMANVAETLTCSLRTEISCKLNRLPLRFFDRNKAGEILSRVTSDLDKVAEVLQTGLLKLIVAIGTIIGSLIVMFLYSVPLTEASYMINSLQSAIASAERTFELLDEEEEVPDKANVAAAERAKGHIAFEHVSFGYDPGELLMKDISFEAKPGQKIAVVGSTGAGKTTLINLLMRFYEIHGGRITIDGVASTDMSRSGLRHNFGMVLQDTWLFGGTIAENIAYGKADASREEIIAAAKAAKVDYFIRTMPKGYDTVLDNEASNLSAGQRQLLTIARVFLCNPSILILDEATSSVDTRTEVEIGKAMKKLMSGRTSFVIAHRLSTIRDADIILFMEKGTIIEQGSHKELLEKNGAYAKLYYSQFE